MNYKPVWPHDRLKIMTELYIGLMSGTSMDAIDAVLVDFSKLPLQLIATHSEPISTELKKKLLQLCFPGHDEINCMGILDVQMGILFAQSCNQLLKKSGIDRATIKAIGSHGQTIRHYPHDAHFPFTLQIGDPNIIAARTGITTIADFRRRDLASGGQGAPLVPAFHNYFFRNPHKDQVIINIGGIANITFLPANLNEKIIGFDTGPGNTLLDSWINQHQHKKYDQDGQWAKSGKLNNSLLAILMADEYLKLPPPKSTGREHFNLAWLQSKLPENIAAVDVQNTLTEFTAQSIMQAINLYATKNCDIIICGGGAHNNYLLSRLEHHRGNHTITLSQQFGIDPDWIEAIAFAWLAQQTLQSKPGNIPSVTGARQAVILGGIYQA